MLCTGRSSVSLLPLHYLTQNIANLSSLLHLYLSFVSVVYFQDIVNCWYCSLYTREHIIQKASENIFIIIMKSPIEFPVNFHSVLKKILLKAFIGSCPTYLESLYFSI